MDGQVNCSNSYSQYTQLFVWEFYIVPSVLWLFKLMLIQKEVNFHPKWNPKLKIFLCSNVITLKTPHFYVFLQILELLWTRNKNYKILGDFFSREIFQTRYLRLAIQSVQIILKNISEIWDSLVMSNSTSKTKKVRAIWLVSSLFGC